MDRPRTGHGFTLLEVLVAMAILGLGMIAVFSGMSQSLSVTSRLRDKTLASWVATNRITEMQVTGDYPESGNQRDTVDMANAEWLYDLKVTAIPDLDMRRIDINVSFADTPDDILATVIGFIGEIASGEQTTGAQRGTGTQTDQTVDNDFGSGWEPPVEQYGATQ